MHLWPVADHRYNVNAPAVASYCSARRLASIVSSVILVLGLCGCLTDGGPDITGSLGEKAEARPCRRSAARPRLLRRSPSRQSQGRRRGGAISQGAARHTAALPGALVLEQATIAHPDNKALLAGYGRALADNSNFQQAFGTLGRAHSADDPDWRILWVQGAVLDRAVRRGTEFGITMQAP